MFATARAAVNLLGLGLLLGGVLLVPAPGQAGVLDASWTAPTTNADGSRLTDLASYRLYYGTSNRPCPGSSFIKVASSTASPLSNQTVTSQLTGLSTGTLYYVSVTAVDTSGSESPCSTPVASAVAQMKFTVSPTGTVNFESVNLGSFVDQTFTVQSTRGGTVSGTVSTSAPFSIVSGSPFTLTGVGATQTVTVRFRPTTSVPATTSVNFTADGDTISRGVTGTGPADTTPPTVTMTSPTTDPTYSTSSSILTLAGTASDDVGVTQVTWTNSRGGSGTAAGTASWVASGIALQPGTNVLTVTARDAAGKTTTASLTVIFSDTAAPTISITAPTPGATVGASPTVVAVASDNVGVVGVQFQLNGTNLGAEDTTNSYSVTWDITTVPSGTYTLTAVARDAAGNLSTSAPISVTVDLTSPAVVITAPSAGSSAAGRVAVAADATDNVGVAGVQFQLDGAALGAELRAAPYALEWDTTTVSDGPHTLTAVARDAAGNVATSAAVNITVANPIVRVSLAPEDTFINLNGTNYSTSPQLNTYTWPNNRVANAILMKFDLSGIPAGAVVQEATLHLALVESDKAPEDTYTVTAHKVVGQNPIIAGATGYTADGVTGWTPNHCCHANAPLAQADISPAYATQAIDKTPGYKAWTITAMVQEWLADPATNSGLLLNSYPSQLKDRYRYFASMEHPDSAIRPFLHITYSVPPTGRVSLAPEDTSINLNATNDSTSPWLATYTWPDNQVANAILMKFDLSSIPAGAVVQEATLHLALVESDGQPEGTYTVTAHKVVGQNPVITGATGYTADGATGWTPNPCCYGNGPLAQADISAAYDTQAIDKTPGYKAWTITALVQEWLADPATNSGLLLNSDPSQLKDRYRYFASMEHPDSAIRPFLRITYSLPPSP